MNQASYNRNARYLYIISFGSVHDVIRRQLSGGGGQPLEGTEDLVPADKDNGKGVSHPRGDEDVL